MIVAHLPAAECFQPDSAFFCGGEAVDGGTSDTGDAAGTREDEASALMLLLLLLLLPLALDPGSQAFENETGCWAAIVCCSLYVARLGLPSCPYISSDVRPVVFLMLLIDMLYTLQLIVFVTDTPCNSVVVDEFSKILK